MPTRYSRSDLAALILGKAAAGENQVSLSNPSFLAERDGYYPAFTATSLGEGVGRSLHDDLIEDFRAALAHTEGDQHLAHIPAPPRANVLKRLDRLTQLRSMLQQPEVTLAEFRCFHQLHEGPEKPTVTALAQTSVRHVTAIDDTSQSIIVTSQDVGKLLVTSCVYSVEIVLPEAADIPAGFSIRMRNLLGPFRIAKTHKVNFESHFTRTGVLNQTSLPYLELAKNLEYTIAWTLSGWNISTPAIDVTVTNGQQDLILEKEEPQGIRVMLPALSLSNAGFSITACNRTGLMTIVTTDAAAKLRRIPEGLETDLLETQLIYEQEYDTCPLGW